MRTVVLSFLALGFAAGCSDSKSDPSSSSSSTVIAPGKLPPPKNEVIDDKMPAASDAAAVAVVDAAIKAHGGADALARAATCQLIAKGVFLNTNSPFTTITTLQLPDRYRNVMSISINEGKTTTTYVVNRNQGWQLADGSTTEVQEQLLNNLREDIYLWSARTLLPLKEKGSFLTRLPDADVEGKPMSCVKVSSQGKPALRLFFDKSSHRLCKISLSGSVGGGVFEKEIVVLAHGNYQGATLASKWIESMGGRKSAEITIESYKFPGTFPASTFEKP